MKAIQLLVAALFGFFAMAANAGTLEYKSTAYGPHSALYSFSDVYRLTVGGAAMNEFPLAVTQAGQVSSDFPMRVVAAEPPAASYVFSIVAVPQPQRGLLLLSGLALVIWVARRRLIHAF